MNVGCPYCGGWCKPRWEAISRTQWREMPKDEIHDRTACGTLTTHPLPSPERLIACYSKHASSSIPEKKLRAKHTSRQHLWYLGVTSFHLWTIPCSPNYIVAGTLGSKFTGFLDVIVCLPVGAFAFAVSIGDSSGESRSRKNGQAA